MGTVGGGFGDTPGFTIFPAPASPLTMKAAMDFLATSYMLYQPPPTNGGLGRVTFVPLHYVVWQALNSSTYSPKLLNPKTKVAIDDHPTSDLPEWDRVLTPMAMVNYVP